MGVINGGQTTVVFGLLAVCPAAIELFSDEQEQVERRGQRSLLAG